MKIGIIGAGAIGYTPARAYCTLHMEELVKALPKTTKHLLPHIGMRWYINW